MTTEQKNLSVLAGVISRVASVPVEDVRPEKAFIEDFGLDSLAMVAMVFSLEEVLDIDIPEQGLVGVRTVQDLLMLIDRSEGTR